MPPDPVQLPLLAVSAFRERVFTEADERHPARHPIRCGSSAVMPSEWAADGPQLPDVLDHPGRGRYRSDGPGWISSLT